MEERQKREIEREAKAVVGVLYDSLLCVWQANKHIILP